MHDHFGLRQRPFPATPDPACYYPATSHERALSRLLGGLSGGEGILLLTGYPGTGKTLAIHCLLERLGGGGASIACLTNCHLRDRASLLQAILYDLALPYEGRGEQEMRLGLTEHLLRTFADGRRTILIVDEAHHLTPDLLEELRLLGNLEARAGKAVQVLLVGQLALLETLRWPELASLRQRLAVRAELQPLPLQEAADYLLHHLRIAGGRPERLLADEALEMLARASQGLPRLLNQAAHQAFCLAAEAGAAQVDAEAVLEALDLLGLELPSEAEGTITPRCTEEGDLASLFSTPSEPALAPPEGETSEDAACRLFITG
jgi:type II secretory pathway predicted ATPase ExeA